MNERSRLYVYETKMEFTFDSSVFNVKEHIGAILMSLNTEGKTLAAACFGGKDKEPMVMVYKTANGKILHYLPE